MIDEVIRHYDTLLAHHYTWMFGVPFKAKVDEQRAALEAFGVEQGAHGTALDLGSGPGFQAIALAELGFKRVIAVDTSRDLLDELATHRGELPIELAREDLRSFSRLVAPGSAEAIVCMGDTLTHLDSRADVFQVLADAHAALQPGGLLILTFRDLSVELTGLERFLPVRSDPDRIMTCVLDYEPETVVVNDLLHVRAEDGWRLHKSSYRKLRLRPDDLASELASLGFRLLRNEHIGRMDAIVAGK